MGNGNRNNLFSTKRKQLLVRTGSQRGKGTDANVCVILFDNNGRKTETILLDCKFRDDFESGHTDNFPVNLISEEGKPLGDVTEIELWRDEGGLSSDWFCDVIFLMDLEAGILISKTSVLASTTIYTQFVNIFVSASLPSEWNTIEDMKKAFRNHTYEFPKCAEFWNDDEWFAAQRLAGTNPSHIELCTEIPMDFAVSEQDLRPLIEDRSLEDALKNKKLLSLSF